VHARARTAGVEGIHVSSVTATGRGLVLGVETGEDPTGCPDSGVVAVGHGRRRVWFMTSCVSANP
jgi:transposase